MDTGEFFVASRIGQVPSEDPELDQKEAWIIAEERLSLVRHELRNRLGTLRNAAFYLQRKNEKVDLWTNDERVPYFFSLIEDELKKTESLLAREFSLLKSPQPSGGTYSLRGCVERAVASLPSASQVELLREMPPPSHLLSGCEVEVAVLARCLLRNAVEASPKGSGVQVKTKQLPEEMVLEIADRGFGLTKEEEVRAFQPFTGTKGQAGVGLNVARRLCQRYGAQLRFQRPAEGGLVAEVRFPRNATEMRAATG